MPQTKTTKKKPAAKVGGGGVGTRKSKFNLKLVIPIVVVVAALGGFYIFRKSGAAEYYALTGAGDMQKGDGLRYQTDYYGTVSLSQHAPINGNKVCAMIWHIKPGTRTLNLKFYDHKSRSLGSAGAVPASTKGTSGTKTEICTDIPKGVKDWYGGAGAYQGKYFAYVSGDQGFGVHKIIAR